MCYWESICNKEHDNEKTRSSWRSTEGHKEEHKIFFYYLKKSDIVEQCTKLILQEAGLFITFHKSSSTLIHKCISIWLHDIHLFRIRDWIIVLESMVGGMWRHCWRYTVSVKWMAPISIIQMSPKTNWSLIHSGTKAWTKRKLSSVGSFKTYVWDANYIDISCQSK